MSTIIECRRAHTFFAIIRPLAMCCTFITLPPLPSPSSLMLRKSSFLRGPKRLLGFPSASGGAFSPASVVEMAERMPGWSLVGDVCVVSCVVGESDGSWSALKFLFLRSEAIVMSL